MNAMEFLSRAYRIDQQIQSKVDQLQRIRASISGTGLRYGDVRVQTSGQDSRVENAVLKILEEERVINEEIDRLVEIKREIREVIDCVEDVTLRLILEKRHLLFQQWDEIAIDLGISSRWAKDRHKEALKVVNRILENDSPCHSEVRSARETSQCARFQRRTGGSPEESEESFPPTSS